MEDEKIKPKGCTAIIAAGGISERMGLNTPKQFIMLKDKPVLAYSLEAFDKCPLIDRIIIVSPEKYMEDCEKTASPIKTPVKVIKGGETRQESVYFGLLAAENSELAIIHDGARPFVSQAQIESVLKEAKAIGGAILAAPLTETLKQAKENIIQKTIDRENLFLAQTPQAFNLGLILKAHEKARKDGFSATDDASLLEYIGVLVKIIPGSPKNIKITTKEDLALAQLLAREE